MDRQHTEQEKIFANHISDEKLIYKIYLKIIQLNRKKSEYNRAEDMNTYCPKRTYIQPMGTSEKMNMTNHQGNANQNHDEISPHTCQNGYYKKKDKR